MPTNNDALSLNSTPTQPWEQTQTTERQKLLEKLRPTLEEIAQTTQDIHRACLLGFHRIGRILIRDQEEISGLDPTCRTFQLSGSTLEVVAAEVGIAAPTLSKCKRFAQLYDRSTIDSLTTRKITWSHMRLLLAVPTEPQRDHLIQRISEEHLTADELGRAIQKQFGNRKPGAGRTARPPASLNKALSILTDGLARSRRLTFERLFSEIDDNYDLPTDIRNQPPDELTQQQLDELAKSIVELQELSETAQQVSQRLQETLPYFNRVFADRAASQSEVAEDMGH